MKKPKFLCLLLVFSLALGLFLASASASAESSLFSFEFIDDPNKTFIEGVTKEEIKAAFDEEIDRLVTQGGWDLSKVSVGHQPAANPWPSNLAGSALIAAHLYSTEYSSGSAWGAGYIMLVFNPHRKKVYTIKDGAMSKYSGALDSWTTNGQDYGYPLTNQFTVDGNVYQNFTFGYMTITGNTATFTAGKWMDQDGTEAAITKDDYAENGVYPLYNSPGSTLENYISEYKAAINSVEVDIPLTAFRMDWSNLWMQILTGADFSSGSIWGQNNVGIIVYNTTNHKMVFVRDKFVETYTLNSADYGYPMENDFEVDGIRYQNFELGYMKVENDELTFKASHRVNESGEEYRLFTEEDVGEILEGLELSGITAEQVKTAITSKYTESMGLPSTFVNYYTQTNVLYQRFMSESGETSFIFVYSPTNVVVLTSDMWKKFENPEGYNWAGFDLLGLPKSDAFTKDGSTIQNFSKGYLEITSDNNSKVVPGANIDSEGNITVLDFSHNIFYNSAISKLPKSWNVTPEELVTKFKAKYTQLKNSGFIVGVPGNEGIRTWTEHEQDEDNEFADGRGMLVLAFQSGGSTANPWYDVTMYMVYNPVDGNIYLIKDNIMNGIATFRSQLGAPVGEAFTYSGLTIQNFQKGYVAVTAAGSATYKDNLNFSEEKGKEVNLDGSDLDGSDNEQPSPTPAPGEEEQKGCAGCGGYTMGHGIAILVLAAAAIFVMRRGKNEKV